jgi:type 1 glutamine amidotransferase
MRGEGGLVIYQAANNAFPMWPEWNRMIALNWQGKDFGDGIKLNENGQMLRIPKGQGPGAGHAAQHEYEVKLTPVQHPVTQGFPKKWMHVKDELYHGQRGPALNMVVLAYAFDDPAAANHAGTGQNEPLVYTVSCGKSRVFVDLMGHDVPQTSAPDMVALLTRGTEWAATGQVTLPLPEGFKGE